MKQITLSVKERNKLKRELTREASRRAFILSLAIPNMVVRDKFSKLIPLEKDGLNRQERFIDFCIETYEAINGDYVSINDLIDTLLKETGVDLRAYKL